MKKFYQYFCLITTILFFLSGIFFTLEVFSLLTNGITCGDVKLIFPFQIRHSPTLVACATGITLYYPDVYLIASAVLAVLSFWRFRNIKKSEIVSSLDKVLVTVFTIIILLVLSGILKVSSSRDF